MADEISVLEKRLKELLEKFEDFKEVGIDEEILIIYISDKTKVSKKKVREMLYSMNSFYEKLIKKNVLKGLKK